MMTWKRVRRELLHAVVRGLLAVVGRLPRRLALALFGAVGGLAYRLRGRERRQVLENLALAMPELDAPARRRLARQSFVDLGRNAADVCRSLSEDPGRLLERIDFEGEEHFRAAREGGRGVVAVTAHMGAWELLAASLVQRGARVCVPARPLRDARYQRLIDRLRGRLGVEAYPEGDSLRTLVRAIRDGAVFGLLADQNRDVRGVWVPFFGRPAYTPVGPAEMARLSGVAILPMVIHQVGARHRVQIAPPIELDWRQPGAIEEATRLYTANLESWIRRFPTQWVWMYERWKGPRQSG